MKRVLMLWSILGAFYVALEVLWRGESHPSMFVVGGLCGVLVGLINQLPRCYKTPVVVQSLIGAGIVLVVEFSSGLVLNVWLGLAVWDYSDKAFNLMGQVCLLYAGFWLLLMPFAIWMEDTLRWVIYIRSLLFPGKPEPKPLYQPYTIKSVYHDFFTGK